MKLYAIVGSPNTRKVLTVINHLGIDVDIKYLDLFSGENDQVNYTVLNPNAMVPTLVDADIKLWESNAINHGNLLILIKPFGTLALEAVAKPSFMNTWETKL